MISKIINFLKYNNAAVFIVLAVFLLTGGVFAQTETGQQFIGQKEVSVKGEDNTLLREVDLDKFDMDFKIGKIEKDEKYYYVTYTFLDIVKENSVWQYKMSEKQRKVPLNIEKDLGEYLAEEFKEFYQTRLADLKKEQTEQLQIGEQKRQEITEYDGLVGQTLDVLETVFPDYKAVKAVELPSPVPEALAILPDTEEKNTPADSLENVYNDYINEMDPDKDNVFGSMDNCPTDYNPDQADDNGNGKGDVCDTVTMPIEGNQTDKASSSPVDITADKTTSDTDQSGANNPDNTQNPESKSPETEPDVEIIEINQ